MQARLAALVIISSMFGIACSAAPEDHEVTSEQQALRCRTCDTGGDDVTGGGDTSGGGDTPESFTCPAGTTTITDGTSVLACQYTVPTPCPPSPPDGMACSPSGYFSMSIVTCYRAKPYYRCGATGCYCSAYP